jgi:hypothetical protein
MIHPAADKQVKELRQQPAANTTGLRNNGISYCQASAAGVHRG